MWRTSVTKHARWLSASVLTVCIRVLVLDGILVVGYKPHIKE